MITGKKITPKSIIENSAFDQGWYDAATWRQENKKWLDLSFAIALRILTELKTKSISQVKLAEMVGCTPQYINKVLKGTENLQLETIVKIENALETSLIHVVGSHECVSTAKKQRKLTS
jgi:ribosome-binding protein aMBF1 (putative translation factor)